MAFRFKGFERDTETGEYLYWSNDDGWVFKDTATIFTEASHILPGVMAVEPVEQTKVPSITIAVRGGAAEVEEVSGEVNVQIIDYDAGRVESNFKQDKE
jgi:hypothetical protein